MLDGFSHYVVAWTLCTSITADDLTTTLELALAARGGELDDWLAAHATNYIRGAPCHPQTQDKIERWHQTLKNRVLLEPYRLPGELEAQGAAFIDHYSHRRVHESLRNFTPADVRLGRGPAVLPEREHIRKHIIQQRRLLRQSQAA